VAELRDLQATVARQMGAGAFRERIKLSGEIAFAKPSHHLGADGAVGGTHQDR
jgi:hypothetical protein